MTRDLTDELLQAKVKARLFGGDHTVRLGRLVILERLGSGAMGAVYAAYDPRLDRRVAVKVLHAGDAGANARALEEARMLAKLEHPNVVRIHDAGEEDGSVHIVMELVTGTPLRAWITRERTWRDVVRVLRDAGAGLAAAHRMGVIHRDVKPDNVVVGDDSARIVDFGVAVTDATDEAAGTPRYMAPEVLGGKPATRASDQFSFGVTLFEALYGERPHEGTTREELRTAALAASSARPRRATKTLAIAPTEPDGTVVSADASTSGTQVRSGPATQPPAWVHAIAKRALASDPAARFASMDELVAALSRDRRRTVVIAIAAAALVLGAVGGALAMRASGASCDTDRATRAWNPARVRAALGDAPWTTAATTALDAYAGRWTTAYHEVCSARQSDRLLELRTRCLDRALDRFTVLADALAGPLEPSQRAEAATAIAQLPPPPACTTMSDPAELALPADRAQRAQVIAAEHVLDRAWADYALGRYREAREAITALETQTAKLDADGLHATLATLAAAVESRVGDPSVARGKLERALAATAKAHATELEHVVWTRLLRHELFAGNPARVLEWETFARAAAARAGLQGAELDGIVGEALRDAGQFARAREVLDRALASTDRLRDDQRAIIEMNLGSVELAVGQPDLAEAAFQRALALATTQLGDGHPTLAIYRDKLAEADRARGRITSALAHHDWRDRLALGDVELARGNKPAALALYDRAAALDTRLDLGARRIAAGMPAPARPPLEPFTVERAPLLALTYRDASADLYKVWQGARTEDPALTLAVADAGATRDLYQIALRALADEPSRMRLRALRGIGDTAAAQALAAKMPELVVP